MLNSFELWMLGHSLCKDRVQARWWHSVRIIIKRLRQEDTVCVCAPQYTCSGQRTIEGRQCFPSTMWVHGSNPACQICQPSCLSDGWHALISLNFTFYKTVPVMMVCTSRICWRHWGRKIKRFRVAWATPLELEHGSEAEVCLGCLHPWVWFNLYPPYWITHLSYT